MPRSHHRDPDVGVARPLRALVAVLSASTACGHADTSREGVASNNSALTWGEQAVLSATDSPLGGELGASASLSGDTALLGGSNAPFARVFTRSGVTWAEQAKLGAADGTWLGFSVALDGDTALLGTRGPAPVHVLVRTGATWSSQAELVPSDLGAFSSSSDFGSSVALDGDTALVGTHGHDAAYVFVRSGSSWTEQAKLVDPTVSLTFGEAVAVSADTAVVGVMLDESSKGAVYVFVRSGVTWTVQAKLATTDDAVGLGQSLAISGDTVVAGARLPALGEGAAYVFTRTGTSWSAPAKLGAEAGLGGFQLGKRVAIDGDTLVVSTNDPSGQQAAHVLKRSGSSWAPSGVLAAGLPSSDGRGPAVALSGATVLVGSPYVGGAQTDAGPGGAYVYVGVDDPVDACADSASCGAGAGGGAGVGGTAGAPPVAGAGGSAAADGGREDEGGCGCRLSGRRSVPAALWWVLAATLFVRRARRHRCPRPSDSTAQRAAMDRLWKLLSR